MSGEIAKLIEVPVWYCHRQWYGCAAKWSDGTIHALAPCHTNRSGVVNERVTQMDNQQGSRCPTAMAVIQGIQEPREKSD